MQYMGSKNRYAKYIVPIIQKYIDDNNVTKYLEPFVGGANIIDKIQCKKKIGCDKHKYLIALLKHIQHTTEGLPNTILFEEYDKVRSSFNNNTNDYPDWYKGLVGFCGSFGSRWFDGGYARASKTDVNGARVGQAIKNLVSQSSSLKNISFIHMGFQDIPMTKIQGYVIYCDPPYRNTKNYSTGKFPYEEYYQWVRNLSKDNIVLCSEYWMPDDFECIWEKETTTQIDSNREARNKKNIRIEKLFRWIG